MGREAEGGQEHGWGYSPWRLGISLSGACLARCLPPWRFLILLQELLMNVWFLQPQEAALRSRSGREGRGASWGSRTEA